MNIRNKRRGVIGDRLQKIRDERRAQLARKPLLRRVP